MFQKKPESIENRMKAIDERVAELQKKRASKLKDIEERKMDCSRLLSELAMKEDEKAQESLKLARRALERLTESFNDLDSQISLLRENRKGLEGELVQARLRDLPKMIEGEAEQFNLLLDEAITQGEVMKAIHAKMKIRQDAFLNLSKEHGNLCRSLGLMQPLELAVGLGKLV